AAHARSSREQYDSLGIDVEVGDGGGGQLAGSRDLRLILRPHSFVPRPTPLNEGQSACREGQDEEHRRTDQELPKPAIRSPLLICFALARLPALRQEVPL